jgi:hypothetical protein
MLYDVRVVGCSAQYLYVRLDRGRRNLTVRSLADQLPDAREVYLLPAIPSTPSQERTPEVAMAVSTSVPVAVGITDVQIEPPVNCAQHVLPTASSGVICRASCRETQFTTSSACSRFVRCLSETK